MSLTYYTFLSFFSFFFIQSLDGDGTLFSEDVSGSGSAESTPLIYACATMWHETWKEMAQLMKSIFRYCLQLSLTSTIDLGYL